MKNKHLSWYKEINNNFIIASRAYFFQEATQEAILVKEFITDLGVIPNASGPMTLFCDNTGAIALAKEPRFHKKTRHIKRSFNSIREYIFKMET